ncbi:hypothetical protein GDO86_007513 [Hymenochirus boettgeri]|uniref:Uncharacterized protein n=1 Tax=Hymenochirus boettgeri TaxID=247094 RepID=A0A8T2IU28_9PIPI|nr:hypothetical protein GDO86_007513 [Hymenochirus boettgeri]
MPYPEVQSRGGGARRRILVDLKLCLCSRACSGFLDDSVTEAYRGMKQYLLEGYKDNLKRYQFSTVEGNHYVHLNEPEKVAGIITDFLQEKRHIQSKI